MKLSKNKRAEKVCGLRPVIKDGIIIDFPEDFGYLCPKCGNKSLRWSEYNCFCWCEKCNEDFPTCLCIPPLEKATDIFLDSVETAKSVIQ